MTLEDTSRSIPPCPDELTGPTPRKVRINFDGDARFLVLIVVLFLGGTGSHLVWNCYDGIRQYQQRAALRRDGRDIIGEVTGDFFPRHAPERVEYKFLFEGVRYSGEAKVPSGGRPGTVLKVSDQILVRFLPSDPKVNHPEAWEWSPMIGAVWILFDVFFTSMACVALFALLRDRKLAREGKVAEATVTGCSLDDRTFCIEYEFRTEEGFTIRGKGERREGYLAGARVWILYLPERPQRNELFPLLLFDVVD